MWCICQSAMHKATMWICQTGHPHDALSSLIQRSWTCPAKLGCTFMRICSAFASDKAKSWCQHLTEIINCMALEGYRLLCAQAVVSTCILHPTSHATNVSQHDSWALSLEHWVLSIESSTCVFDELTPAQCDSSPTCAERHDFRVALAIAAHQLRVWDPHANCWS